MLHFLSDVFVIVCFLWVPMVTLIILVPFIKKKLVKRRGRIAEAKEQKKLDALIEEWTGWGTWMTKGQTPFVIYLNIAGDQKIVKMREYIKLSLPEDERPKEWILCLSKNTEVPFPEDEKTEKVAIVFAAESKIKRPNWRISEYLTMHNSRVTCSPTDIHGYYAMVSADNKAEVCRKILQLVHLYKSVHELWAAMLKMKAVPILLETKGSLGKSPSIETVREMIEEGLRKLSYVSIDESLLV